MNNFSCYYVHTYLPSLPYTHRFHHFIVYKVQQKTSGFIRAVKAIKRKHIDTTAFGNEIEILKTVDHPNVIKL